MEVAERRSMSGAIRKNKFATPSFVYAAIVSCSFPFLDTTCIPTGIAVRANSINGTLSRYRGRAPATCETGSFDWALAKVQIFMALSESWTASDTGTLTARKPVIALSNSGDGVSSFESVLRK